MANSPTENVPNDILIGSPSEVLQRAALHYNKGEYAAAVAICRKVIEQNADNPDALYILGQVAIQTGESDAAVGYFVRIVSQAPSDPRFNRGFAIALEHSGRNERAIHAWTQYLILEPNDGVGHYSLARLLTLSGQHYTAAEAYTRATALLPADNNVRFELARALHRAERLKEAIAHYELLLSQKDDWAACQNGLAAALRQVGQYAQAIAHGRCAVQLDPGSADANNNLGLALFDAGHADEAMKVLEEADRLRPNDAEILNNLGVTLAHLEQRDRAQACFHKALATRPGWSEGHLNLANLLRGNGLLDEAIENYQLAIEDNPNDYRVHGSLALAWLNRNEPGAAIVSYEKALALAPDEPELRKGLGIAQLLAGNFQDGWRNYEWRLRCEPQRAFDMPRWHGEDLCGGMLLVHAEQGFGDTLQFCRYLATLAARANAGKVTLECQQPLHRLLGRLEGADTVVPRGAPLPAADWHIPLLSLPGVFETTLDTIPSRSPYLQAPAPRSDDWRKRLSTEKPNIGLIWKGNPRRQDDNMRSCPLSAFEPLLRLPGLQFHNLQVDATPRESEQLTELGVCDLSQGIEDFADTAAIVSALDLVISVDTATAHLCGALGKPVWVVLGYAADWRYLLTREDMPWYPSMRLFRQPKNGDWHEPITRLLDALPRHVTY